MHNHPYIKQFYYEFIKKDGAISNETYLTTEEQCNYIINILNEDKKKFDIDAIELENLRLKIEEKKSENNLIELKINEYKLKQKEIEAEIKKNELELKKIEVEKIGIESIESVEPAEQEEQPDQESNYSYNFEIRKINNGIRVPKVYQYDINNLKDPINIYESPKELIRINSDIFMSSLKNAIKNNTIYKNYRWIFVNRNEEPPAEIPETVDNNCKSFIELF